MSETVRTRRGQTYRLSKIVGRGGEAVVHRVAGEPDLLAKIYTRPKAEREPKLAWMIADPPDDPAARLGHTSISWPQDLLFQSGRFCGYLMPHIRDTVPALNVFHPRLRLQTFHQFTRRHLHNTAYNIAAALGAIHDRQYVVGDLNESNVLVARSTLVTIIDTDSFQVRVPGRLGMARTYLCEVGKPEYLPPELQGADLKKTVREPQHDDFALAVLVFQLLMDGNHPFRARWVGSGDKPSFPERIKRGLFPYRDGAGQYVEAVLPIETLDPRLVDLFKRCFILGHDSPTSRPRPGEWERALGESAEALVGCPNGHFHAPHLDGCPECNRDPLPRNLPVRVKRGEADPEAVRPAAAAAPPSAARPQRPRPRAPAPAPPQPPPQPQRPTGYGGFPIPSLAFSLPQLSGQAAARARQVGRWAQSPAARSFLLQPALWALIGFAVGGVAGTQFAARSIGQAAGLVGGLTTGALVGDVVEKKVGWEIFLGILGALAGMGVWYLAGYSGGLSGWIVAAGAGGVAGSVLGRYGRSARLTLLWAACGALGGWMLGTALAGAVSPEWLSGALGAGTLTLITGVTFAVWKKFA